MSDVQITKSIGFANIPSFRYERADQVVRLEICRFVHAARRSGIQPNLAGQVGEQDEGYTGRWDGPEAVYGQDEELHQVCQR